MAVTLQQIAEAAGVSRGTVDRALKNRGRINSEVAERIKKIADEMGYYPNRAGRALAMAKRSIKIGVIVQSVETPFMQEVLKGIAEARQEVERMGGQVHVTEIKGISARQVISTMEEMREHQYNGIALMPVEDELLKRTIDRFVEEYQIPIVTFNTDLEDSKRICFVGQDTLQSGRTAAGLMGEIIGGEGKVAVISGHSFNPALNNRAKGFRMEMKAEYSQAELLETKYSYDDNWLSSKITEELLEENPGLKGIYMTSHGEDGVCNVLKDSGKAGKIKMIANDFVGDNKKNLEQGNIHFLIGQNPYFQGSEPIMILFRMIFDGEYPLEEYQYTDIVIKNKYNI